MLLNTRKKQLNLFIGREYLLSFIVSFVFFFFIFFINQILLLARRILLSNVDFFTMLNLVVLAIPQFLLYTFPFSSLSASAMVIGNLNSTNELLALRSCGFSLKDIFKPILLLALVISLLCFTVADILLPLSSNRYQQLYVELLTKTPGVELKSNSSNVFDDFLITNGEVKDNIINDIVLIADESNSSYLINSEKGELNYLDINNLIYSLELNNPTLLVTEKNNDTYQYANSSKLTYFIDFSSSLKSINSNLPSNLPFSIPSSIASFSADSTNGILITSSIFLTFSLISISSSTGSRISQSINLCKFFISSGVNPIFLNLRTSPSLNIFFNLLSGAASSVFKFFQFLLILK